jgi:hypothetical protein
VTRDKAIVKVRKLRALSGSSCTSEATSAAAKAGQMMRKYGLTEADVVRDARDEVVEVSAGVGFEPRWKFVLAIVAGQLYSCKAVRLWSKRQCKVKVVGLREHAETAADLLKRLLAEVERLVKIERRNPPSRRLVLEIVSGVPHNLRSYLDSFCRGVVMVVAETLLEDDGQTPEGFRSAPEDLWLVFTGDHSKIKDHIRVKFPIVKRPSSRKSRAEIDELALARGYHVAQGVDWKGVGR